MKEKIIAPGFAHGYPYVILSLEKKVRSLRVHRLVAQAFIPNPENKPEVNHKDGNKQNNYISNLEWCTQAENMQHAFATGLNKGPRGSRQHKAKLNEEDVKSIRKKLKVKSIRCKDVAKEYGVSVGVIYSVRSRKTWKHV